MSTLSTEQIERTLAEVYAKLENIGRYGQLDHDALQHLTDAKLSLLKVGEAYTTHEHKFDRPWPEVILGDAEPVTYTCSCGAFRDKLVTTWPEDSDA